MLRRTRRPAAVLGAASLVVLLAACGSDAESGTDDNASTSSSSSAPADDGDDAADEEVAAPPTGELDGVSFEGEVGESLTATWSAEIPAPSEPVLTTLVEGDGEQVANGDTVSAFLYLGNGTSQADVYSDYDQGTPESLPFDDQLDETLRSLLTGATYGSRVATVTTPEALFGAPDGGAQLGFGADDALVVVADVVEKAEVAPTPSTEEPEDADPSTQPSVVEEGGNPTGLDFSGIEEPALDTPVQRVVLTEGDGAEVAASDTVTVNYLGSTYEADAPFDESYTGEPLTSPLSGLIQGWSIGLTGVKVGSRVLLQIPPAFGYGAEGAGGDIPGNATLWFVIDVVEATPGG